MKSLLSFLSLCYLSTQALMGQTASLHIVEENGPRSERINLVFLSEGYTNASMPNFAGHVNTAIGYLFSREPWQKYRSYCNIYRLQIASNQDGTDNGSAGGDRDTYFESGFYTPNIYQLNTLTGTGQSRAYSLLNTHIPECDIPVVMVNDLKYGGSGGPISVATINISSAQVVEHEIGHSFAGLSDEYDTEYTNYSPYETANSTQQTNRALIKWNHWIDSTTPVPTPETLEYDSLAGLFEGAMYRTSGWYRPHNNSVMRNIGRPCGVINREQFVLNYYSRVSPMDGFLPMSTNLTVTAPETLSFSVIPKVPVIGSPIRVNWKINGQLQAGETLSGFSIASEALGNGSHTVTATLTDPTSLVRRDPEGLLTDSVTWTLDVSGQLPTTLAAWRAEFGRDTASPAQDGYVNLMKYALSLDPLRTVLPSQMPVASLTTSTSQYLTLTVPRRTIRNDVDYIVEVSSDLASWTSGAGQTVTLQDQPTSLVVRDAQPTSNGARRFMRLKVVPH